MPNRCSCPSETLEPDCWLRCAGIVRNYWASQTIGEYQLVRLCDRHAKQVGYGEANICVEREEPTTDLSQCAESDESLAEESAAQTQRILNRLQGYGEDRDPRITHQPDFDLISLYGVRGILEALRLYCDQKLNSVEAVLNTETRAELTTTGEAIDAALASL